jgi:lauroyl/myristoyl acyltransferase
MPRPYRFGAAKALARALAPLVQQTSWYRAQRRLRIDGVSEIALHHVLNIMANSGALFDPEISVDGAGTLNAALKNGQGVLMVAPHALLSLLLFRYLYDINCVPTVLSAAPSVPIYGRRLAARAVQPSPAGMFGLRSALRSGGVVCAMIDQRRSHGRRTIEVETPEGPIYISDALIRLAELSNANVIFTAVRLDKRRGAVLTFAAPETAPFINVETITRDFVSFLQEHVAAVASPRVDSPPSAPL